MGNKINYGLFSKEKGFIGIGWLHDSHSYLEFDSIDEIKKALVEFKPKNSFAGFHPNYKEIDPSQAADMIWNFTHTIKKAILS